MFLKKIGKYVLLAVVILVSIWTIAMAVVYFVVDINEVKNYAITMVNKNSKGELKLGEVKLKLFPVFHFEFNELKLLGTPEYNKMEVVACKKTLVKFNFISLIMGKPKLTLELKEPQINFIKNGTKNNFVDLIAIQSSPDPIVIPPYLLMASYVFELQKGYFNVSNDGKNIKIEGMNLDVEFDPVNRNVVSNLFLPIQMKDATLEVDGSLKNLTTIKLEDINEKIFSVKNELDASGLYVKSGNIVKDKSVPLKIQ